MAKEQKGLFPEQPGGGVQGLFEQSRRGSSLASPPSAARPTPQSSPPNLPGSTPSPPKKPKKPKKKHPLGALRFAPHLAIAVLAIAGVVGKKHDSSDDVPKISQLPTVVHGSSSSETPAYKTMSIVASGARIHNGVYRTSGGAIDGAATRTTFEFAVNGRGSRQRIVYYAGVHVRDRSCDRRSRDDSVAGLVLYDDELARTSAADLAAASKDGDERLTLRYRDASTLTGTFRFGGYTGCPTGGHFTFTATRAPANNPVVAPAVWAIGG